MTKLKIKPPLRVVTPIARPVLLRVVSRQVYMGGSKGYDASAVRHEYGWDKIDFLAFNYDNEGSALAINFKLGMDPFVAMYPEGDIAAILDFDNEFEDQLSEFVLEEIPVLQQMHDAIEADAEPGDLM